MSVTILKSIVQTSLVVTASVLFSSFMAAEDRVITPPLREEFASPDQRYVFELSTPDNWRSGKSVGRLLEGNGASRRVLWTRPLPHQFRPRYVLVGDTGNVLLVDEWANVKSRFAVMVLDRQNQLVAQHDFEAVRKVLDLPVAQVVGKARLGWWIVSGPTLEASGGTAVVETAGKRLRIRIADGNLSLAQ